MKKYPAPAPARRPDRKPAKISVLVPVYNGARFLPECLESVLAQDYAPMEILLADDGSTDGSLAVMETYAAKDPRIRCWQNRQNLGMAGNWNQLLREAGGDYIKFLFQDDKLLSPAALDRMARALDDHPEAALLASASYIIDETSRLVELRDYFPAGISDGRRTIVRCLERPANLIGEPSVVMFRRTLARQGFDGQLRQLLDVDMWFQLLEQGAFAYVAEPLCAFRRHTAQQTHVNSVNGAAANDDVILFSRWLARPWLEQKMTRRMNFALAFTLRRQASDSARALGDRLQSRMGLGWYGLYWLARKITRPVEKLERKLRLKMGPLTR
jgi:glycosyltransferase involved in cell wall biosynthesis